MINYLYVVSILSLKSKVNKTLDMNRFFLISVVCFLLIPGIVFSQATNFITDDCNGVQHSLFDSLDAGNVIVIAWVMPCGPCATYSITAYNATQTFVSSHPGRVHFYMADDYANTSCANLNNWANSNGFPSGYITTFSSNDVSMDGYGTHGMPKVVVLGGVDHTIYFNENDIAITKSGVELAINNALSAPMMINEEDNYAKLIIHSNPVSNGTLNFSLLNQVIKEDFQIRFFNYLGQPVKSLNMSSLSFERGSNILGLDVSDLKNGLYYLNITSNFKTVTSNFLILNN